MPNFGYESVGGSYQSCYKRISGSVFTCLEDGIADSISAYGWFNGFFHKVAIYKHSDLSLVGETESARVYGSGWGVFNFVDPKPSLTADTEYILVLWTSGSNTRIYYTAGDADQGHYQSKTYTAFPNPLVPIHEDRKYSIYCTYTPSAPPEGWRKLQYFSEPPTGGAFNKLKFASEPPVAASWNKILYAGE